MSNPDSNSTVVVWREPVPITVRRLALRAVIPAVAFVGWALGLATWAVLLVSIAALPSALLLVFGLANLAINRRVMLVHTGGALVWPRSVQEVLLGREPDHVTGDRIEVLKEIPSLVGTRNDPYVTMTAGERSIERFPLHGTDVDVFVARLHDLLRERGVTAERVEPPMPVDEDDVEESGLEAVEAGEISWPDDTSPDYDPEEPPDQTPWRPQRD
jgi:hypothetical protein